jgi:hypothetical protein
MAKDSSGYTAKNILYSKNLQADNLAIICSEQKIKFEEMVDAANANAIDSAGGKRKRGNEDIVFTSKDGTTIEGHAGEDNNIEEKIMEICLME